MTESPGKKCLNCKAPLTDKFCASCGQKDIDPHMSFRSMMSEFMASFFSFDARVYHTLRLLFSKPGALTSAYLKGKRQQFVPPLKLYLFATFLALFLLNVVDARLIQVKTGDPKAPANSASTEQATAPSDPRTTQESGQQAPAKKRENESKPNLGAPEVPRDELADEERGYFQKRFFDGMRLAAADERRANRILVQLIPKSMFVILPFFALILRLFYWKSTLRYPQWLIFALYFHAFVFFLLALGAGFIFLDWLLIFRVFFTVLVPLYLFFALRKITQKSALLTCLKLAGFLVIYTVILLISLATMGVLTILAF